MKAYFLDSVLIDCPGCGEWIDADSDSCECGWSLQDEYEPEEYNDVQEP